MKKGIFLIVNLLFCWFGFSQKSSDPTIGATTGKEIVKVDKKAEILAGKKIYENNCAKCHYLHKPEDFSRAEWKTILPKMKEKAQLSDADIVKIYKYITSK